MRVATLERDLVELRPDALEALSVRLDGPVLYPGDGRFDKAVRIWNGMISATPALVVQPASTKDVQRAVRFADANGLLLSIKGGGHNIAGTALADRGVTLDMSRMRTIEVDVERRVAHVGPGCLLGDVDRATQRYGLATPLGWISETGVAGLTLGGGFGYLTRRFGWTVDNLEEVEIVTADGQVRRAAGDEHEDLFWALRGGGGNFGVVTRFTLRLHEVGPRVTAGVIVWDADAADKVLELYRDVAETASRDLTLGAMIRLAPAAPFIPDSARGRPVVALIACHTGNCARTEQELAPIRAFGQPIADLIVEKPYVEQQSMFDATQPKGLHQYWKSEFLADLTDELLHTYRQHAAEIASPLSQAIIFQLAGAIAESDQGAASFANRDAAHVFFAAGSWPPNAPDADIHRAWARSAWEAIRPYSTGGNYINAQTEDEDESRIAEAYHDSVGRLAEIKAAYDADNLFRVNRNIAPAAQSAATRAARRSR